MQKHKKILSAIILKALLFWTEYKIRVKKHADSGATQIQLKVDEGVFNPLNLAKGTVKNIDGRDTKVSEPLLEWARQKAS